MSSSSTRAAFSSEPEGCARIIMRFYPTVGR